MPIPPRDPDLPGLPLDPVPPPPVVTPPPPASTPGGTAGTFGGIAGDPSGEMPWVTQQRNMLMGMADADGWPDWIRAAYGLPPKDPNAPAAAPYVQETPQQRRARMIREQGARLAAHRAAQTPVTPGAPGPVPVPGLPPFLAGAVTPTAAEDGFAAPPGVANRYPMLTALSNGGDFLDELRKGGGLGGGGGSSAGGGGGSSPAAGVPSPAMIAAPRRGLFS